jgi:hypothetical protein
MHTRGKNTYIDISSSKATVNKAVVVQTRLKYVNFGPYARET